MCDRAAPCVGIIRTFLAVDVDRVYLLEHCGNGHTLKPETAPAPEPGANVCGLHHHPRPCATCQALWRTGRQAATSPAVCGDCQQPFNAVGGQTRCPTCQRAHTVRPCEGGCGSPAPPRRRYCEACKARRGRYERRAEVRTTLRVPLSAETRRLQDGYKAGLYGRVGLVRQAVEA